LILIISFNPRTREGCDEENALNQQWMKVSIHAPARGATKMILMLFVRKWRFNPRTREGCDAIPVVASGASSCFNPRTREGCDWGILKLLDFFFKVSIHAPARGATFQD